MDYRNDNDLFALPVASPAVLTWTEPGWDPSDGAEYDLVAWIDRYLGTVQAVTTEDGDEVYIDLELERLIDEAREAAREPVM